MKDGLPLWDFIGGADAINANEEFLQRNISEFLGHVAIHGSIYLQKAYESVNFRHQPENHPQR